MSVVPTGPADQGRGNRLIAWLRSVSRSDEESPKHRIEAYRSVVSGAALLIAIGGIFMCFGAGTIPYTLGSLIFALSAAATAGVLVGFLFGIPRALTATGKLDDASPGFSENTNLEQISDWLTKIIVGVSLVQARELGDGFADISRAAAQGWGWTNGAVFAGCLLLTSALVGFMSGYVWTRTDFALFLESSRKNITALKRSEQQALLQKEAAIEEKEAALQREQAAYATVGILAPGRLQASPGPRPASETATRSPKWQKLWESDPNKGQFSGRSVANGRQLQAQVQAIPEDPTSYAVSLRVSAQDEGAPLTGPVRFHLHPTFVPQIHTVMPTQGIAELLIVAKQAFTVGVETSDGTRLELDLEEVNGVPEGFKGAGAESPP